MPIQNRLLTMFICLLPTAIFAQDKIEKIPVKFGRVNPEDFSVTANTLDSAAGALVVADYGTSSFEGDTRGWFSLEFKHSKRIRILKRSGFDAATISIPLYVSGNVNEKIQSLRAITYNLEDGKVVETKLEDKSIFTDKVNKHLVVKKFTFPALKEGSIVEFTYTQTSPFLFNLQPWEFQGGYPCLWSEYQVDMPNFFQYVTMGHGYLPYNVSTSDSRRVTFHMTDPGGSGKDEPYTFEDDVVTRRWVIKNAPALKEEPYTTTVDNYISRIEFQLSRYNFPNSYSKDMMGNWYSLSKALLEDDDFGVDLYKNNSWLDEDMKTITRGASGTREKAEKIYAYLRDNFTCTAHSGLWTSNSIKTVYKNKNGSEAELNLLLTAMLHHEKIDADPVILSTRSNGFPNEIYPLLTRFNYVITRVNIDSSRVYLDASEPWLGFGRLPERCYNGYARVLNMERPTFVSLSADSLVERKMTLVIISNGEKGGLMAHLTSKPGFNETCRLRDKVRSGGTQEFMKTIQAAYSGEMSSANLEIDSLKKPDLPLEINYDIKITPDPGSDLFYFNPMLLEGYKENPFKAAERNYPVEMPCATDEMYTMNMEVPDGYTVDEMPKSAKVLFNDDEGSFEYLIQKNDNNIQFLSRIKLKKANFKPEDYASLREFFGFIVKKQGEQIVFKKKK